MGALGGIIFISEWVEIRDLIRQIFDSHLTIEVMAVQSCIWKRAKGQTCKLKGAKVQSYLWQGAKGQTYKLKELVYQLIDFVLHNNSLMCHPQLLSLQV